MSHDFIRFCVLSVCVFDCGRNAKRLWSRVCGNNYFYYRICVHSVGYRECHTYLHRKLAKKTEFRKIFDWCLWNFSLSKVKHFMNGWFLKIFRKKVWNKQFKKTAYWDAQVTQQATKERKRNEIRYLTGYENITLITCSGLWVASAVGHLINHFRFLKP